VCVQQGGASVAGAWSRGGTSGPPGDVTGVKLDPRVETSVEAYTTLNELLTDYIEHVSQHCHFTSDCPRRRRHHHVVVLVMVVVVLVLQQ